MHLPFSSRIDMSEISDISTMFRKMTKERGRIHVGGGLTLRRLDDSRLRAAAERHRPPPMRRWGIMARARSCWPARHNLRLLDNLQAEGSIACIARPHRIDSKSLNCVIGRCGAGPMTVPDRRPLIHVLCRCRGMHLPFLSRIDMSEISDMSIPPWDDKEARPHPRGRRP